MPSHRSLGFCVLFAAAVSGRLQGQEPAEVEIPAVHPRHFSHVAGKYRITSVANPTEVEVEKPITLRVRIIGEGPAKHAPQRSRLDIFPPGIEDNFHLEQVASEDVLSPERKAWEFVYRLRPKSADVTAVPGLKLVYYAPGARRFQTSYADEIPIKVTKPADVTAKKLELKVVSAPETFFEVRPVEVLQSADQGAALGRATLALLYVVPPVGCLAWCWFWRRRHPSERERQARNQSRAAKIALQRLRGRVAGASEVHAVLSDYLRQRLDLRALSPTAAEVALHLRRRGVDKQIVADWERLFAREETLRFSPAAADGRDGLPLEEAIRLIRTLEADPCVAR